VKQIRYWYERDLDTSNSLGNHRSTTEAQCNALAHRSAAKIPQSWKSRSGVSGTSTSSVHRISTS